MVLTVCQSSIMAQCKCHVLAVPAFEIVTYLCRESDFAGQQQIASKLHKLVGADDDYYIWWTIVAVTLQAKAAHRGVASALPAAKLFQLAEIMTAKQAQKGSLQSYEQLSLYLHVLQVCEHTVQSHTEHLPSTLYARWAPPPIPIAGATLHS